ncbi:hypothetical protein ADICYQ_5144 [Cyclobacterium qasimii M12-11B]|uniref:Uncharacterized protein n=1 Tax=Cyclobacterium qasimii M12-11B TaxID=641524 RepID=S7V7A5_9BACT|nr:hypothetical protein ADICYQ_5144 [Cyclobacterium qasimii M12-11B]
MQFPYPFVLLIGWMKLIYHSYHLALFLISAHIKSFVW